MKHLTNVLRKLRLRQILTIFLAGAIVLIGTACNSGDMRGARPNNPPVQAGGANNPHKQGGDGYTKYKMSPSPDVSSRIPHSDRQQVSLSYPNLTAKG